MLHQTRSEAAGLRLLVNKSMYILCTIDIINYFRLFKIFY